MKIIIKITVVAILLIILILCWAPWVTEEYAVSRVVERLGGPETQFDYLGETLVVRDIPKKVSWFPFGRFVYFPGEAGWFVSFYGSIK